ncbi:NUDIX hydrolase [Streptacidiphilus sp. PAMC 29251]
MAATAEQGTGSGTRGTGSGTGTGKGSAEIVREGLPDWLLPVRDAAERLEPQQLSRFLPPAEGGRRSAVLVLFGSGPKGPDLLLIERARSLRSHAGQPSFPGGALDPEDGDPRGPGPVNAALREAWEETGLDPSGVQVFGVLPNLYIPVSNFVVTPVLGWWREQTPVAPVDPAEVAAVFRVPIDELAAPERRARLKHPSGFTGPAFLVEGRLVWGFTAGVIDRILHHAGLEQPWDTSREIELSEDAIGVATAERDRARERDGAAGEPSGTTRT